MTSIEALRLTEPCQWVFVHLQQVWCYNSAQHIP
jgi:hypothetical protein